MLLAALRPAPWLCTCTCRSIIIKLYHGTCSCIWREALELEQSMRNAAAGVTTISCEQSSWLSAAVSKYFAHKMSLPLGAVLSWRFKFLCQAEMEECSNNAIVEKRFKYTVLTFKYCWWRKVRAYIGDNQASVTCNPQTCQQLQGLSYHPSYKLMKRW